MRESNTDKRLQQENAIVYSLFSKMTLQEVIEMYLKFKSEQEVSLDDCAPVRLLEAIYELENMFPEPETAD